MSLPGFPDAAPLAGLAGGVLIGGTVTDMIVIAAYHEIDPLGAPAGASLAADVAAVIESLLAPSWRHSSGQIVNVSRQ
jgi:hypothetical protein